MTTKKVYSVNISNGFILDSIPENFDNANILLLNGEGQISPELFDEDPLVRDPNTNRISDIELVTHFQKGLNNKKIKLIICIDKAALMACALAGGKLIHSVSNHDFIGLHRIKGNMGEFLTPSNHTQMMYLSDMNPNDYELILWSLVKSSQYAGRNIGKANNEDFKEPEFVLFKTFDKPVLAIMPNISKMRINTRTIKMTNKLINKYLNE